MRTRREQPFGTCARTLRSIFATWIGAFTLINSCAAECVRYNIQVAPLGCAGYSVPRAINNQSDLAGRFACGGGNDHAFSIWNPNGAVTPLNLLPPDYWSEANDINDAKQITGWMEVVGFGIRGFLYSDDQTTDLGSLAPASSAITEAIAINQKAEIVGYTTAPDGSANHAFRWIAGQMTDLNLPVGPDNEANDINDMGQIVGWMGSYPAGAFPAEAFLWDSGAVTPLGMPEGATNSTANAISNTGIICGYYSYPNSQGPGGYARRALAWIDGNMTDLGVLPGYVESFGFDVNYPGDIVGYCSNPPLLGNNSAGFVWHDGAMINLDSLLAPDSVQYHVRHAWSINNNGQIAADVSSPSLGVRAALLTPVPPLPGDTNCDWMVNTSDLLTVINGWGPCQKGTSCPGNVNDDDFVNVADLLMVLNNWT